MGLYNFQPRFVPFFLSSEKTKDYDPDSDKIAAQLRDALASCLSRHNACLKRGYVRVSFESSELCAE